MESPAASQPAGVPASKGRNARAADPTSARSPGPDLCAVPRPGPHPGSSPARNASLRSRAQPDPSLGLGAAPRPEVGRGSRSDHPAPGQEPCLDLPLWALTAPWTGTLPVSVSQLDPGGIHSDLAPSPLPLPGLRAASSLGPQWCSPAADLSVNAPSRVAALATVQLRTPRPLPQGSPPS